MYKNARKIKKYSRKSLDNEIDFYLNSISLIVLVKILICILIIF